MTPKHIVIDGRLLRSGTGKYVLHLLGQLEHMDTLYRYTVLIRPEDQELWKPRNKNFQVVSSPYAPFSLGEQLGLKKQLLSLKPDLVHFPIVQQPAFYKGITVTTINDLTTVHITNARGLKTIPFKARQAVYKWLNRHVGRTSQQIITYSSFVKDDFASYAHISPDKITVIPLAADPITEPASPIAELQGKQFLLYVGRPTPHKNLGRLIDAFVRLRESYPKLQLVLAGKRDVNYEFHARRVEQDHIPGVHFTGSVSESQLRWLYQNCAVYVFPSLSEGFGLPGLEAMAHSAPVASSNATCLPEIYGDAAQYFNPLDVADMAAKIGEVLDDPILREDLVDKGRAQAAKYSWSRMAKQTLAVYDSVLGLNPKKPED